ncbi:MAG TPA: SDR family NAD(P)-dependent oxidoreductase, partial [Bradyrhizobium sp.]|nr:SDR family NAD(P)-dependent oxidoreductase [Bradyrhizobium sp.]
MGRLNGKIAVITGATSGIGLHTAEIFVAEGARIVV